MLDDMILFRKLYDFTLWLYPTVRQFPKSEKYVLGERLEHCAVESIVLFIQVNEARQKEEALHVLYTEVEKLRILVRLAKDLKLLAFAKYEYAQTQIHEIHKLLGGLKKKFCE